MAEESVKITAKENRRMVFDPKGFFVIFLNRERGKIVVEHNLNVEKDGRLATGKLNVVISGESAEAVGHTIIRQGLISRLEHAFYLGRELEKAERALKSGEKYVQDA